MKCMHTQRESDFMTNGFEYIAHIHPKRYVLYIYEDSQ